MTKTVRIDFDGCRRSQDVRELVREKLEIDVCPSKQGLVYQLLRRYAQEPVLVQLCGLYGLYGEAHTAAQLVWFALVEAQAKYPFVTVDMVDAPWRESQLRDLSYSEFGEIANPLVLELSGCRYVMELHQRLQETFALPEYYGKNWDALWDCLRDRFPMDGEWVVEIVGAERMQGDARASLPELLEVFADVEQACGNVRFVHRG